jgi:hypothetical protein
MDLVFSGQIGQIFFPEQEFQDHLGFERSAIGFAFIHGLSSDKDVLA